MNLQILFWIFISIFSLTSVITLLGITGVIKTIKDKYLNALFAALIIEVIGAVIGTYKSMDIEQTAKIPDKVFEETALEPTGDIYEDTHNIIEAIKDKDKIEALILQKTHLQKELDDCKGNLKELDKDFYSYIIKLRNAMNNYPEHSVNIVYQPEKKQKEYELLKQIFIILDEFDNPNLVIQADIQKEWLEFKIRHGRAEENPNHILEYDITLLVRDFLNKFYPLQ